MGLVINNINYTKLRSLRSFVLNFGPQHPAAHGVLRLLLEVWGERILFCDAHIGLLHRGTEKLAEYKLYSQVLPYFDRLDYVSMMSQEHSYALSVEKLSILSVPNRAQVIRTIYLEITRLLNHLMSVTTHALDVGALTPFLWGFEEREKLMFFYEQVSGARLHSAFIRIGGLAKDIPLGLLQSIFIFAEQHGDRLIEIEELLTYNRIWRQRLVNVGFLSSRMALSFGFTGVMLRSTGVLWDLRRALPYEFYFTPEFSIPFSSGGDSYTRYLLRLEEMRESLLILKKVINSVTNGIIKFSSDYLSPIREVIKLGMESLIRHFKFFSSGFTVSTGTSYTSVEAPKGEFGVFLTSDGGNMPYRCKIRAPGFSHLQGICYLVKNTLIADLVVVVGTLDIVFGEVDR